MFIASLFSLCLGFITACISPKIVEEMKTEQSDLKSHNKSLKKENLQVEYSKIQS